MFLRGRFRREQDRYRDLADRGQSPNVLLIGCCDSRVSPEVIFDADRAKSSFCATLPI